MAGVSTDLLADPLGVDFLALDPFGIFPLSGGESGSSNVGGVPFPALASLYPNARIVVQAAFGANPNSTEPQLWNWYDITTSVRQADGNGINIAPVGRSDETSTSQPAGCTFQLDNTSGDYTNYNPYSKWYRRLGRNTPIRILITLTGYTADLYLLYQGQATGWVPGWDTTCNLAIVTVTANGKLRQLQQGKKPLRSSLWRYVQNSNQASVFAFWALEDGTLSTYGASGITGGLSMNVVSTSPPVAQWGANSTITGAAPVVDLNNGVSLQGNIKGVSATIWRAQAAINVGSKASADTSDRVFYITDSTGAAIQFRCLYASTRQWKADYTRADGTFVNWGTASFDTTIDPFDGKPHRVLLDITDVGGTSFNWSFKVDSVVVLSGNQVNTVGSPVSVLLGGSGIPDHPFAMASVLFSDQTLDIMSAMNGYTGELAVDRLIRLCLEQGVQLQVTGTSNIQMGPQGVDSFINLIRECETADDGQLYDGAGPGISYISRIAKYNQTASITLDVLLGQLDEPFEPFDDDQRNRNIAKVDRKNGSSATYEDSTSDEGSTAIGDYDTSVTVNTNADTYLLDRAQWEVGKGTVAGFRYPTLGFDMASNPELAIPFLKSHPGSRTDVLNVSSKATQHPPGTVSVLLEGYGMFISQFDWKVNANCSQYSPYQVGTLGSSPLQTAGSSLATGAGVGATSLSVNVTGRLWSTSAGDYPSTISVSGILITVTAVSGVSSPQTFTVDPTTVTKQLNPGDAVTVYQALKVAL